MHNGTPIIDVTPDDERPEAPELLCAKPDAGNIIIGVILFIIGVGLIGAMMAHGKH